MASGTPFLKTAWTFADWARRSKRSQWRVAFVRLRRCRVVTYKGIRWEVDHTIIAGRNFLCMASVRPMRDPSPSEERRLRRDGAFSDIGSSLFSWGYQGGWHLRESVSGHWSLLLPTKEEAVRETALLDQLRFGRRRSFVPGKERHPLQFAPGSLREKEQHSLNLKFLSYLKRTPAAKFLWSVSMDRRLWRRVDGVDWAFNLQLQADGWLDAPLEAHVAPWTRSRTVARSPTLQRRFFETFSTALRARGFTGTFWGGKESLVALGLFTKSVAASPQPFREAEEELSRLQLRRLP